MNEFGALIVELALVEAQAGRYAAAETLVRLIAGGPDNIAYVLYLLGHTQYMLGRYTDAATALQVSVSIDTGQPHAENDLSATLFALGHDEEALAPLRRALAIQPDFPEASETMAIELLRNGDLREGWHHYEARFRSRLGAVNQHDFPQPRWDGREAIAGRTILLHAEQGVGDVLMFARYAGLVAARGARVILGVHRGVASVLAGLPGVSGLVEYGDPLPRFDCYAPLLSLPHLLGTELDNIPAEVPYLFAAPDRVLTWKRRLGPRVGNRIGVVFSGNPDHPDDHRRSIPLAQLAPLLSPGRGREFHVLQQEIRATDRVVLDTLPHVREHSGAIQDFADTAALISLMDVVVTVDTAVAHLAGAMGWPVWLLLAFKPDWRWMWQREDSPWYPTMWLFRQPRVGDWDSVLAEVARQLREMLA